MSTLEFVAERVDQGWEAAWDHYEPGRPIGDPVGEDESYNLGWWSGVGCCAAWHEGWAEYKRGVLACPYAVGSDDECFRAHWLDGYGAAFETFSGRMSPAGHA